MKLCSLKKRRKREREKKKRQAKERKKERKRTKIKKMTVVQKRGYTDEGTLLNEEQVEENERRRNTNAL